MRFIFDKTVLPSIFDRTPLLPIGGRLVNQSRHLRFFNPIRPEIAIVNNSGLFFSLFALKMHGQAAHNELSVIVPRFWMDNIHPDYDHLSWGQSLNGLPRYIQQEFLKIYPEQPEEKPITWKQYKNLLEAVKCELKNIGISLYSGSPIITRNPQNYFVQVDGHCWTTPNNTFFYNSFRTPRIKHGLSGFPERSHTELYQLARADVPESIILLGGGRSTIWLAQHFPRKKFACLKYRDIPYPLLEKEMLPANITTFCIEDFAENERFQVYATTEKGKHISNIYDTHNKGKNFIGEFFASIGLQADKEVTKRVLPSNLLVYPYSGSLNWVAPEEVPIGSLMEATLRWAFATDNLDLAFQANCFHEGSFSTMLTAFLWSQDIVIDERFFTQLKQDILKSYKRTHQSSLLRLPNDDEALEIYRSCYKKIYMNPLQADLLVDALKQKMTNSYAIYDKNSSRKPTVPV